MKKSTKIRISCLIIASVMLIGALTLAAITGSPYEILKNALLDSLTDQNVTMERTMTMMVSGVTQKVYREHAIIGDTSYLRYDFDANGNPISYIYETNGLRLCPLLESTMGDERVLWYTARVDRRHADYKPGNILLFSPEERASARTRFLALLVDILIGDLKNNVTMSSGDGIRHISGVLTENQLPEFTKAGLDMFMEDWNDALDQSYRYPRDLSFDERTGEYLYEWIDIEAGIKTVEVWRMVLHPMTAEEEQAWDNDSFFPDTKEYRRTYSMHGKRYYITVPEECIRVYTMPAVRADYPDSDGNPLVLPWKSLMIDSVRCEADVDKNGCLLSLDANATLAGVNILLETDVIEINVNMSCRDIGTSAPVCPVPGAEQLLTSEYIKKSFSEDRRIIYFTLNTDGSINADSITAANPDRHAARIGKGLLW
ncbi:MAG: hypothetical protein FWH49_04470 [Clostridiales bacterium]|nr:hypothetical protein [Clostridiales bacterium]